MTNESSCWVFIEGKWLPENKRYGYRVSYQKVYKFGRGFIRDMKKKRELPQPTKADILKGIRAYETRDLTRDAMYRVAKEYLQESWGDPGKIADSLGVVLLTWNQPFYRFGVFSFAALEKCISKNLHLVKT